MSSQTSLPDTRLPLRAWGSATAGFVALPFVFPLIAGPSVSAWQLLVSWCCAIALMILAPRASPWCGLLAWLALVASEIALSSRIVDPGVWLPACAALVAMALAAAAGAGWSRHDPAGRAPFATGLLLAGLLSALLGLLQYYGLAEPLRPWTTQPELGQAYGNLRQRNQFATLISMALISALWLHAAYDGRRVRVALLWAMGWLLLAAAASTSRTGLLQLLGISGVAAFIAWRERRPGGAVVAAAYRLPHPAWLLAMVPAYFAAAWLLPHLASSGVEDMLHRLRHGAPDDHSRLVLWHNVLTLIARHPLAGWGWGELGYAHYITLYPGPRFVEILDNAHNLPLHLAVELGIPAAALICGGFIWLVLAARPWRERDPTRLMAWGLLAVIVLHSLLEYPLWYGPFQLVFGLCLGLLWPAPRAASAPAKKPAGPGWRALAAIVLMAIVGYAGWDYTRISQIYLPREERLPAYRDDTLAKLQGSWLFASQVRFAELSLTPVTQANAAEIHAMAERALHFSPEPRVIVKLIESAALLGRDDEAFAQAERFRRAFPADYARWLTGQPADAPPAP
ncbi:Wzy polymerase domain-containing protein [Variovorax sp. J22G21]|uniref:PglL family O-oligosaccharyltransferase n=1 Tax=Variovorax fucosicus TaxID=3053517 RepID=UPI0025762ACE|nr:MULTISPECIES: Wzy polymerase domain-containing protein [unclassified Variovorax]MDM0039478.1 Wzy polymerase domain-containing protein [Variovorax sp. J22R193]MDM0064253.1 Wzy polymerase domain-containing protein [Variovorax sp. J22G21]